MLYLSNPGITPLNLNLIALPEQTGSKDYEAKVDNGDLLVMRFSSGWLTVSLQKAGEDAKTEIIKQPIAPFGTFELHPKQICYLLGLTVKDNKIDHPSQEEINESQIDHPFNFGDNKLHWSQEVITLKDNDITEFVDQIQQLFSDVVLYQFDMNHRTWKQRVRQIPFMMDEDQFVQIGIGRNLNQLAFTCNEYRDYGTGVDPTDFDFKINIEQEDYFYPGYSDFNGINHLSNHLKKYPQEKMKLALNWSKPRGFTISASINKDNSDARDCLEKLFRLCHEYFYDHFEPYNIVTQKKITLNEESYWNLKWVTKNYYHWIHKTDRYGETDDRKYAHFRISRDRFNLPTYIGFKPTDKKTIHTTIESMLHCWKTRIRNV